MSDLFTVKRHGIKIEHPIADPDDAATYNSYVAIGTRDTVPCLKTEKQVNLLCVKRRREKSSRPILRVADKWVTTDRG